MTELRATLRLQFHSGFRFADAAALVPYFVQLGVSHIYASPVLKARPGSTYGYDMVDPTCINRELGGEEELRNLADVLHREYIGLIVDFVPNHMAVGGASNPWWLSVLEWGKLSPYSSYFDINWNSPDPLLNGQLLVPFLRTDYGEVLASGELPLLFSADTGQFYVQHFDHRFPISPPTYAEILAHCQHYELNALGQRFKSLPHADNPLTQTETLQQELCALAQEKYAAIALDSAIKNFTVNKETGSNEHQVNQLHQLLERQPYRLASWRTASDDINWRRFFDINELAAVRTEHAEVFNAIHTKIFNLIEDGVIDGLRIDHIDGLANPRAYCRKLRRCTNQIKTRPDQFAIYVEKILADGEQLPNDWQVDGTTGYEFMNQVSLLQHDPLGALQLQGLWQELSNRSANFNDETFAARRLILSNSLAGDLESLAQQLLQIARTDIATRDLTLGAIRRALIELIVHFPVYRTYSNAGARTAQEQAVFTRALAGARANLQESDWPLLEQLDDWLGNKPIRQFPPGKIRRLRRATLAHFQQLTSPTAAKAVEDTACYRSAVLLSRNDVGFDPAKFSATPTQFHQFASQLAKTFPDNLLATATHDHKRGEDTRARLAVISERAVWFANKVKEWRTLAQPWRSELEDGPAPSPGDELALYQTLLGSWPLDLDPEDRDGMSRYLDRLSGWQEKAIREAKLRTHWVSPNTVYEAACRNLLQNLLINPEARRWRADIFQAAMSIAPAGALNSLSQTLLRLTCPGVPDLYQGCDLWDFSLVDPDNRRPVDYAPRQAAMESDVSPENLIRQWRNGYIKQYLISKTLGLRTITAELFSRGEYRPLETIGPHAEKLLAFTRQYQNLWVIVIVPRLVANLLGNSELPQVEPLLWGDTRLMLPWELANHEPISLFSNRRHQIRGNQLALSDLLADFPVNLLYLSLSPEVHHASQ